MAANATNKEIQLLSHLKKNPFVLAPMAGITDCAFRSFMREMGAGAVISELVSATGLKYSSDRTRTLMKFTETQHPVGIQLFGEDLDALHSAAQEVEQMGADFVDLNFGCPVPKVVKKGAGSAVLKNLVFLRDILRTVKSAVQIPVTIKVRTGWDQETRNTHEVVRVAYDEGITWVAIHGRTRAQGYSGNSDWSYMTEVARQSPLPILGNGDLTTPEKACGRLRESGCAGVMIGRGCLKNPWIFEQARHQWFGVKQFHRTNFKILFQHLHDHLCAYHAERLVVLQLKKLGAWYSSGYPGSSQFRKQIFSLVDRAAVLSAVHNYFDGLDQMAQEDTSGEAFLMGGHG